MSREPTGNFSAPTNAPRPSAPLVPPIELSAVYRMSDPASADAILAGEAPGYVYARDGHPNAADLAAKCSFLHGADAGIVCATGMAALAAAVLALVETGDEILLSDQLYGKSVHLLRTEMARLGIQGTLVDTSNLVAVEDALARKPRLLVAETISNPTLRVANISELARLAHERDTLFLVDNTFATPHHCQPLRWGADFVQESVTKMMNGHSDVILGYLGGRREHWARVPGVVSAWGFSASPFDCWLALRGLGTLEVRMERASANALSVARWLSAREELSGVLYPGLETHPDHSLAAQVLQGGFGPMISFTLRSGREAATRFIQAVAESIPFAPSLGDLSTTLSHPESTSHREYTQEERQRLGITGGMIRLSIGIEPPDAIIASLERGLASLS